MAISLGCAWGISRIRLLGQPVLAFLIQVLALCQTCPHIGRRQPVSDSDRRLGGHSSRSRVTKDLQDGPHIMASGNSPKQD